ncbi:hypothetical protein [Parasedimentitalea maritima]|uniref:Uncharacterized protein n=1 Tax=Parasedimentitalea maritima TaxID=2578117 RepID=A0A6A4RFK3_9RHOB|nr:hypothetical protein [Zongyanglinia marina]KAE9629317.1 hypothetical protein GP644_12945 [Zongyanglinia marina]
MDRQIYMLAVLTAHSSLNDIFGPNVGFAMNDEIVPALIVTGFHSYDKSNKIAPNSRPFCSTEPE